MPPLLRYSSRRLALAGVTLIGVVTAVFIMTHILPSDPAALRAGPLASEELIAQYRSEMWLDRPLSTQFLHYAQLLSQGDLGNSWRTQQPVVDELAHRLPATLELAATAFLFALIIGLTLGMLAAVYARTWVDQAARGIATLGASLALFWLALVGVHIFYFKLGWAPPPLGRLAVGLGEPARVTGLLVVDSLLSRQWEVLRDALDHLWLPALTLAFVVSAPVIKIMRAAMLDTLSADYVRTARSASLPLG